MYIEAIIIGIIIGIFRNGRISNLADFKLKGWGIALISCAFYFSPYILNQFQIDINIIKIMPFIGLVLMWLVLLFNVKEKGIKLLVLGAMINIIVLGVNDFAMPVFMKSLDLVGMDAFGQTIISGDVINYIPAENAVSITGYLGKWIPIPPPYPFVKVLSIGDILMTVGLIVFIQNQMQLIFIRGKRSRINFVN